MDGYGDLEGGMDGLGDLEGGKEGGSDSVLLDVGPTEAEGAGDLLGASEGGMDVDGAGLEVVAL